jgi:predicted transcriptional regulator
MFVFLGAQAEDRLVKTQSALKGLFVSDAMMTDFRTLSPQDTVSSAAQALLAGSQEDFPVIGQGESFGIVRHSDVFKALTANRREVRVTEIMGSQPESMEESAPLQQAAEAMQARNCPTVLVTRGSQVVGLLTVAKINQRIALEAAFEKTVIAGHTPLPLRLTAVVPALAANCDRLYE